jgi:hypothetical protein
MGEYISSVERNIKTNDAIEQARKTGVEARSLFLSLQAFLIRKTLRGSLIESAAKLLDDANDRFII